MYASEQQKKAGEKGAKAAGRISAAEAMYRDQTSKKIGAEATFARDQLRSAETARGLVMGQLGAPGTYGSTSAGQGAFQVDLGAPGGGGFGSAPDGLYGERTISGVAEGGKFDRKTGKTSGSWEVTGTVDDPFETATRITNQSMFSAVSAMVGEAVQLGNREGEMWDMLNNSATGGVMAGAARVQRAAMEQISRSIARGGSARRAGFAMAQKMMATEQNNRLLTEGLWEARQNLENTRTNIMQGNISYAMAWVDNQSGIRDTYVNSLTSLRTFWSGMAPALLSANTAAAGQAHLANSTATDALMESATTRANAISGASQYIGGAIQKYGGQIKAAGTAAEASGAGTPLYGPNPTDARY
jgi:hypothetical protein